MGVHSVAGVGSEEEGGEAWVGLGSWGSGKTDSGNVWADCYGAFDSVV